MADLSEVYPYEKDPTRHRFAWLFFNMPGVAKNDLDSADRMARHVFDDLGCGAPGTTHPPRLKYDAIGGSGGPWEDGRWIKAEDQRQAYTATVPVVDVTAMTPDERAAYLAEVAAMVKAAEDADRAGANSSRDESAPYPPIPDVTNDDEKDGEPWA